MHVRLHALVAAVMAAGSTGFASAPAKPADPILNAQQRRQTAVALNYCRASLHRIRSCPSKRVLLEERDRILNNLNLNSVADAEVVRLYSAVLTEISDIKIADKERDIIKGRHRREFRRRVAAHITAFSLQMATGRYVSALKTGAASWWDYRTMTWNRELDLWAIEKDRRKSVDDKSTLFLDTFWKLARKRSIPDKWLVRADDLDKLDAALRETDLQTRLRVLKRMESFCECYPPYWYYRGRTQQALGQLFAAAKTFETLERFGAGHFRKDELLAAGVANRAAIQDYLRQPSAPKTAKRALEYSGNSWQVNLTCATVFRHHREYRQAEDALLRNLDVELESPHSVTALVDLYCQRRDIAKLTARLKKPETLNNTSVPALLRAALILGNTPAAARVKQYVAASITVDFERRFGPDDVVVRMADNWSPAVTRVAVSAGKLKANAPTVARKDERVELRFRKVADVGSLLHPVGTPSPLQLAMTYADGSTLRVHFQSAAGRRRITGITPVSGTRNATRRGEYRVTAIDLGKKRIALGK